MVENLWMAASLAEHMRGRILRQAADFAPAQVCPDGYGLCLMFGTDFQEGTVEFKQEWLGWSQTPGRALLLVPPFKIETCPVPVAWEIVHGTAVKSADDGLANLLIKEVRYALLGRFQIPARPAGEWGDRTVHTGYYRKHPNAGIFAVTCLPLWSLALLDHKRQLRDWLEQLYELAGTPSQAVEEEAEFKPDRDHFAVMLYLLSGKYEDRATAFSALADSTLFRIEAEVFEKAIAELEAEGLVEGSRLTQRGRAALSESPFAAYADELEIE